MCEHESAWSIELTKLCYLEVADCLSSKIDKQQCMHVYSYVYICIFLSICMCICVEREEVTFCMCVRERVRVRCCSMGIAVRMESL